MHCDVHYYFAKIKVKIQLVHREKRKTNCIKWYSLGGKSKQVII